MRKILSVLLIALASVLLIVSCDPSTEPGNETGFVSFNLNEAKSVTSSSTDFDVNSLNWYICAHRSDGGFWKEGATSDSIDLTKITTATNNWEDVIKTSPSDYEFVDSLVFGESRPFSAGTWLMSIQGRTSDNNNMLVYQSPAKTITVEANVENHVSFEVKNMVGKGKVVLKNITFNFGNDHYSGENLTLETSSTNITTTTDSTVSGTTVTFYSTPLEKELDNGLYTFNFLISVGPDKIATSTISVMVYQGYTVTIEGDLNSLSESGTIIVDQNVAVVTNGDSSNYFTADKLQEAFDSVDNNGTIKLLATVAPTATIDLDTGKTYTLDLGYYSINSTATPAFAITSDTNVVVLGGINSKITSNGVVVNINGCGITLESGSIETTSNSAAAINCEKGTVTINGGEVSAPAVAIAVSSSASTVTLKGGSVKATSAAGKAIKATSSAKVAIVGATEVSGEKDFADADVSFEGASSDALKEFAVAKIGTAYYDSLAKAIEAVTNSNPTTIVLTADVENANGISVASGRNITVDFAGHTYSVEKPGAGSPNTRTQAFQLLKDSTIVFENGTINCTADNKDFTWKSDDAVKGVAMIIQNYANLTLDNMTIDGTNIAHNGNNATARYIVSNNYGNTVINNTTITSLDGDYAFDSCDVEDASYPGGAYVCVAGNSVIIGKIEVSGGRLVINDGSFTDLVSAVKYAAKGATIKLAKNTSGPGIFVAATDDKNLTIDLGGFTYTCVGPAVGSTGTATQAFHLEKDNTITITHGTITSASRDTLENYIALLIQNYCDLTLDGVTLDGTNLTDDREDRTPYVLSNNCGNTVIKDTTIVAKEGDFALDSCKYLSYSTPIVTVSGNSEITGKIDVSGGILVANSLEVFQAALNGVTVKDSVIKLGIDLTLSSRIDLSAAKPYTIDLNGHKVGSTKSCANGSVFNVVNGNVTIKNGELVGIEGPTGFAAPWNEECDIITVRSGATVTVENLNMSMDSTTGACLYAFDGARINVISGTYENKATEADVNQRLKAMLLNQADGKPQAIFVSGGTFKGANPASGDNSTSGPSTFLAEGYKASGEQGNWVVSAK